MRNQPIQKLINRDICRQQRRLPSRAVSQYDLLPRYSHMGQTKHASDTLLP